MKFKLLLLILSNKLKKAAKKNQAFKDFIRNKELKVGIRTPKNGQGRVYVFNQGIVSSVSGTGEKTDVAMVWCDADTAFKVMSNSNEEASLAAMTEKKLVIDGNFKEFMWFSTALSKMMAG
jgi:predicted sulfurtransferase